MRNRNINKRDKEMKKNISQKFKFPWEPYYSNIEKLTITKVEKNILKNIFKVSFTDFGIDIEHIGTRKRALVEVHCVIATVILDHFRYISITDIAKIFMKNHACMYHYNTTYQEVLCSQKIYSQLRTKLNDLVMMNRYGIDRNKHPKNKENLMEENLSLLKQNKLLKSRLKEIKKLINDKLLYANISQ